MRTKPGLFSARRQFELRAYRVPENAPAAGASVSDAEARVRNGAYLSAAPSGDDIMEAEPSLVLQAGDIVAISGPRETWWTCSARRTSRSRTGNCSIFRFRPCRSAHEHGPRRAQASRYYLFGMDPAPLLALDHARQPGHPSRAGDRPGIG